MNLKLIATVLSIAVPGVAFAGSLSGTVQDVTAETMPGYVAFKLSSMPQYCQPPYNYLAFWGDPDTVKAVYAMLMAAADAIAGLARGDELVPDPLDRELHAKVAAAVRAARTSGELERNVGRHSLGRHVRYGG